MQAAASSALIHRGGAALSAALSRRSFPPLPSVLFSSFSLPLATNLSSSLRHSSKKNLQIRCVATEDGGAAVAPAEDPAREAADLLDIRVGQVLRAWRHPEAESLFVEEVDVGEEEPRTICSGLVGFVPLEDLQEARVLVLANLKPRNMRGIKSNGMLLAASDEKHEKVELLVAPPGTVAGERVWFGDEDDKDRQPDPASPNQVQKKKIWETVQPRLRTEECVAMLGDLPMRTSQGPVVCASLKNGRIS